MGDITLRSVKGSELTHQEVDNNFDELDLASRRFQSILNYSTDQSATAAHFIQLDPDDPEALVTLPALQSDEGGVWFVQNVDSVLDPLVKFESGVYGYAQPYSAASYRRHGSGGFFDWSADGAGGLGCEAWATVMEEQDITTTAQAKGICQVDTSRFVYAYTDGATVVFQAFTESADVLTFGTIQAAATNCADDLVIEKVDTDKFIAAWNDNGTIYARCGTVSGTTITLGTEVTITAVAANGAATFDIAVLDTSNAIIVWADDTGDTIESAVLGISGTTITENTNYTAYTPAGSTIDNQTKVSACALSASLVAIVIGGAEAGNEVYCVAATISGTTLSWGTAVQYADSELNSVLSIVALSATKFFVGYGGDTGGLGEPVICNSTISGTTITKGNNVVLDGIPANTWFFAVLVSSTKLILANQVSSTAYIIDPSGSDPVNNGNIILLEPFEDGGRDVMVPYSTTELIYLGRLSPTSIYKSRLVDDT